MNQPKGAIIALLVFLFFSSEGFTQETPDSEEELPFYKHQIELHHDNDFLLFTDWYYTTGSFINYRLLLNELEEDRDRKQLLLGISQEYYTPSNITETNVRLFDRPYAGYSAIWNALTFTNNRRMLDFTFQIGVTGEISGAEGFQSWFHSSNESGNPEWIGQIENAVHMNLYATYTRDWQLIDDNFGVHFAWSPKVALGTKDIFLENGTNFYFGKRRNLRQTMAYHQIGNIQPEFFFVVKFAYRYVIYDGLLEGFFREDSSIYTVDPVEHFFSYGLEGFFRKKRMEYNIGYNYASPRAPETFLHGWITISIARNF